jgi:hypothetical protein
MNFLTTRETGENSLTLSGLSPIFRNNQISARKDGGVMRIVVVAARPREFVRKIVYYV